MPTKRDVNLSRMYYFECLSGGWGAAAGKSLIPFNVAITVRTLTARGLCPASGFHSIFS